MLKIILDTNLFRRKCIKHLEDYEFSSLFEKLRDLILKIKIYDTEICIDEMALLEYVEQISNWYEQEIVQGYEKIFNIASKVYPMQKISFRSKDFFIEDYKTGILEDICKRKIKIIETIPVEQEGGVSIVDIIEKTLKNKAPFDKLHNKDLKDAIISETVLSEAKRNTKDIFVFITINGDDFQNNKIEINNYFIKSIHEKDPLIQIFDVIKKHGGHIDDKVYFDEYFSKDRFSDDIKQFFEQKILNEDYYLNDPILKKSNDKFLKKYKEDDEHNYILNFYITDNMVDYECGIIYDIYSNKKPKILKRYFNYVNKNGENDYEEF